MFLESLLIRVKDKVITLEEMEKEAQTFVQVFGQLDWPTCKKLFPTKTNSKELERWAGKLTDVVRFTPLSNFEYPTGFTVSSFVLLPMFSYVLVLELFWESESGYRISTLGRRLAFLRFVRELFIFLDWNTQVDSPPSLAAFCHSCLQNTFQHALILSWILESHSIFFLEQTFSC